MNTIKWYLVMLAVIVFGMWVIKAEETLLNTAIGVIGGAIIGVVANKIAEMEDKLLQFLKTN